MFIFLSSLHPCHISTFMHKGSARSHGIHFLASCLYHVTPRPMALCPLNQFQISLILSTQLTSLSGPWRQAGHWVHPGFLRLFIDSFFSVYSCCSILPITHRPSQYLIFMTQLYHLPFQKISLKPCSSGRLR